MNGLILVAGLSSLVVGIAVGFLARGIIAPYAFRLSEWWDDRREARRRLRYGVEPAIREEVEASYWLRLETINQNQFNPGALTVLDMSIGGLMRSPFEFPVPTFAHGQRVRVVVERRGS